MAEELTPEDIRKRVEAHENATESRRTLMQEDYDTYRLNWVDDRMAAKADGYQTYTSNEPRTYAKRIISWLSAAELTVRVPLDYMQTPNREKAALKEQFIIGALRAADENLLAKVMPPLRDQLAFHIAVRGWYAGRALLLKQGNGDTMVDITPFDPLHTFFGLGRTGLIWLVHRQLRTREELEAEYPGAKEVRGKNGTGLGIYTYDYYDGGVNGVCTDTTWLKEPAPHYSPRIPVFLGPVGATPPVLSFQAGDEQELYKYYGESVFDENRDTYDQFNKTMSDMMTLVRRSVKPPVGTWSRDGTKTLDKDIYQEGSVVSMRLEENVKAIDLLRMSLDTGPFLAQVSGEMQRGSIPHSVYGDLQFQLSGFAINTLRQGVDASVHPRIVALENAYLQSINLLCDQYATGGFKPLQLSGRNINREYFYRQFEPSDIDVPSVIEISISPKLPQDEMQRFAMAQVAREGKTPLLSSRTIRDDILKVQDVDAEEDIIREEMGEAASPVAMLYGLIQSAMKRGRMDLAAIYGDELQSLLQQKALQQAVGGMSAGAPPPKSGPPGQGTPKGSPTLNPEVLPNTMMGIPPPVPTPQGGPNVPPLSPRPGARARV